METSVTRRKPHNSNFRGTTPDRKYARRPDRATRPTADEVAEFLQAGLDKNYFLLSTNVLPL